MYCELKELLFHPDLFFTRKTGEKTDLLLPAIIVLIGSMVGLITSFAVSGFLNITESRNILVVLTPTNFLLIVLRPFLAWVLLSGILYAFCRLWSGKGTFVATLQNTGYGALPLTILTIVPIINGIFLNVTLLIPQMISFGIVLVLDLITLLFVLWSGYIWIYAMEKTHAIAHGKAVAAASIAAVLYLCYHVITNLGIVNTLLH
jgi:hypothetical protein